MRAELSQKQKKWRKIAVQKHRLLSTASLKCPVDMSLDASIEGKLRNVKVASAIYVQLSFAARTVDRHAAKKA